MIGRAAKYPKREKMMPKRSAIRPVKYANHTIEAMRILSTEGLKKIIEINSITKVPKRTYLFLNL